MQQAHGFMVNYQYDLDDIEKNHEAFAENRTVVASGTVRAICARSSWCPCWGDLSGHSEGRQKDIRSP